MKTISYIVCGVGLLGGLMLLAEGSVGDGLLALIVYGFFLALTLNIKQ